MLTPPSLWSVVGTICMVVPVRCIGCSHVIVLLSPPSPSCTGASSIPRTLPSAAPGWLIDTTQDTLTAGWAAYRDFLGWALVNILPAPLVNALPDFVLQGLGLTADHPATGQLLSSQGASESSADGVWGSGAAAAGPAVSGIRQRPAAAAAADGAVNGQQLPVSSLMGFSPTQRRPMASAGASVQADGEREWASPAVEFMHSVVCVNDNASRKSPNACCSRL